MFSNKANSGFTLLELIVVIVLMALVAGIAAARFQDVTPANELKSQARQVVSLLRRCRGEALSQSRIVRVRSDEDGGNLLVEPLEIEGPLKSGFSITVRSQYGGSDLSPDEIAFYPDGSSSGGEIHLASEVGSEQITVDWLTGGVALAQVPN